MLNALLTTIVMLLKLAAVIHCVVSIDRFTLIDWVVMRVSERDREEEETGREREMGIEREGKTT